MRYHPDSYNFFLGQCGRHGLPLTETLPSRRTFRVALHVAGQVVSMSRITAAFAVSLLLTASCDSGTSRTLSLARTNISKLKSAIEDSDQLSMRQLMSQGALRRYGYPENIDWDNLVEEVATADQAIHNVIRATFNDSGTAVVGWGSKYHVLLFAPRFLHGADGQVLFDGLMPERVIVNDEAAGVKYLKRMDDEQFQTAF